ncbi:mitochondrial 54S ribosomal protein uL29m [Kwoniella dejecticola CBS 10117]|uniref:Large ribosomal subunit protein uL29m n=1 Tax=Kwoniella dejecticola CBS 10117 TaxID=1296121 RepID=A0A1A5ZYY5_9TREE|nr:uncharacterized protein I303_06580 [Kwoniella dejecticola CBS 10117]OBR83021.1 hypothetical protein I303_06580 [Kwoniella dejecticola CBS 10117]
MSISNSISRLPRSFLPPRFAQPQLRYLHTEGRQVDHQGPTTIPLQQLSHPGTNNIEAPTPHLEELEVGTPPLPVQSTRPTKTAKGQPIVRRPARTIPVALPNGDPEPTTYPPSKEYYDSVDAQKQAKHPLWQFFHLPTHARARISQSQNKPPAEMGSLEPLTRDDANLHSGRSWTAAELRQKSFQDLHTLWYVLLKERNVLATQKEERRRLNIGQRVDGELLTRRAFRCRKTMARIKYVLNERRLGLIAAAGPKFNVDPIHVPWSASGSTDPAGATTAIRGESPVPLHILQSKSHTRKAAGSDSPGAESGSFTEEPIVESEEVAKEEVESRDEGFGGGKEAETFDEQVKVTESGKVEKKD